MDAAQLFTSDGDITAMSHRGDRVRVFGAGSPRLLMFVPAAFTPVCGSEVGELSALAPRANDLGVRLIVISTDSPAALAAWLKEIDPSRGLVGVSDHWPHGQLARYAESFDEIAGVAYRRTFAVRADGTRKLVASSAPGLAREPDEHTAGLEWAAS